MVRLCQAGNQNVWKSEKTFELYKDIDEDKLFDNLKVLFGGDYACLQ